MVSASVKDATAHAVRDLACWADDLCMPSAPSVLYERLHTVLFDVLAATATGARGTPHTAARRAWAFPPGHSPVVLGGRLTDASTAAFCNGMAAVCLELDEGNKYAKGHPAAHGFPAVLALAAEQNSAGRDVEVALLVAYEIAARFGVATSLRDGVHPHGNWAIAGAAAGCAKLLGCAADGIAAAIDAGSGMAVAGHFDSALDGNQVRDLWVGAANASGIAAARAAAAGLARNTGTAACSLGDLLGALDSDALTADLGSRFEIERNYFKRHSSCSFAHPAADLAIGARDGLFGVDTPAAEIADAVDEICVSTHRLAAALDRTEWNSPLAAMFSIPFVVAAALTEGEVSPRLVEIPPAQAPSLAEVAKRVVVLSDDELTARLPSRRAARIIARLRDGREFRGEVDNPVGDSYFQPFDRARLTEVFAGLLGPDRDFLDRIDRVAHGLDEAGGSRDLLAQLSGDPHGTGAYW